MDDKHVKPNFEFSRSLNGDKIVFIARDRFGNVRFRNESESKLKQEISEYEKEEAHRIELAEEKAAKKAAAKTKKKSGVKKFLQNTLRSKIQAKKKRLGLVDDAIDL